MRACRGHMTLRRADCPWWAGQPSGRGLIDVRLTCVCIVHRVLPDSNIGLTRLDTFVTLADLGFRPFGWCRF